MRQYRFAVVSFSMHGCLVGGELLNFYYVLQVQR